MGLRIVNNIAAMNAHRWLGNADKGMAKSLERLSSGYRINRAADDAAGLAIAQTFRAEISSLKVASRNTSEATSALQVAEGAVDQISNILNRLKELATQAASANAGGDRDKIHAEGTQLMSELDDIATSTEYAGQKMLQGTFGGKDYAAASMSLDDRAGVATIDVGNVNVSGLVASARFTISATAAGGNTITLHDSAGNSQTITLDQAAGVGSTVTLNFNSLGISLTTNKDVGTSWTSLTAADIVIDTAAATATFQVGAENSSDNQLTVAIGDFQSANIANNAALTVDLSTVSGAQSALTNVQTAIDYVNSKRGDIGAYQNRLDYAAANIATAVENKQAAESIIRDVDMAAEMTSFTKDQILLQSSMAMLAQANMAPQQVLQLMG